MDAGPYNPHVGLGFRVRGVGAYNPQNMSYSVYWGYCCNNATSNGQENGKMNGNWNKALALGSGVHGEFPE